MYELHTKKMYSMHLDSKVSSSSKISELKKELADLKASLKESGTLADETAEEDKG